MLDKRCDPKSFEEDLYQKFLNTFAPSGHGEKFSTMMPPPNVTGTLHLGHALNGTIIDTLTRYKRMRGYKALWLPGTDHAGIATQMVVEKQLAAEGKKRTDLTREEFTKRVWAWKEISQNIIVNQQQKLRISPDWGRAVFTLDPHMNHAVNTAFKTFYDAGLIYREKTLVNWDFTLNTAVSDLEAISQTVKGKMYYIRYALHDGGEILDPRSRDDDKSITIATTRPETMFGDVALAVPVGDARIGKFATIPFTNRQIPIIGDEHADPEKGSGVVKITPAHDFNDFEVGKRHKLDAINILDDAGKLNENTPVEFRSLTIQEARKKLVPLLEEQGFIEKIEDIEHTVPFGERSNSVIEPRLTYQWFLKMDDMAKKGIEVVESGEVQFFPEKWKNNYLSWLYDIRPWCISRQLWWGHQIPAWFGPDDQIFVGLNEEEARERALKHYGHEVELRRETDVLDTWFSAGLWPFSTLGWPNNDASDFKQFFPTDILVTGFDIIFFWVARMIMMSTYLTGKIPFKHVYIHALVRDEKGQKMSKSRGNVLDPLDITEKYGSDALRLALCGLSVPGRDINIGEKTVETYSHFVTKLWNAARFIEHMNGEGDTLGCHPSDLSFLRKPESTTNEKWILSSAGMTEQHIKHPFNQWIISKLNTFIKETETHLDNYRLDLLIEAYYHFVWNTFCDVYLEGVKVLMRGDFGQETQNTLHYVFETILKILHPVMPSVTAYLGSCHPLECGDPWIPVLTGMTSDPIDTLLSIITEVRSLKGLLDIHEKIDVSTNDAMLLEHKELFEHLAFVTCHPESKTNDLKILRSAQNDNEAITLPFSIKGIDFTLYINKDKESIKTVLNTKKEKLQKDLDVLQKIIQNDRFKESKPDEWEEKQKLHGEKIVVFKTVENILDSL